MFKNVKIIVLYQNIGGHKGSTLSVTLKKRVGGLFRVGIHNPLNIIYIIGCLPSPIRLVICGGLGGQS